MFRLTENNVCREDIKTYLASRYILYGLLQKQNVYFRDCFASVVCLVWLQNDLLPGRFMGGSQQNG